MKVFLSDHLDNILELTNIFTSFIPEFMSSRERFLARTEADQFKTRRYLEDYPFNFKPVPGRTGTGRYSLPFGPIYSPLQTKLSEADLMDCFV